MVFLANKKIIPENNPLQSATITFESDKITYYVRFFFLKPRLMNWFVENY